MVAAATDLGNANSSSNPSLHSILRALTFDPIAWLTCLTENLAVLVGVGLGLMNEDVSKVGDIGR